MSFQTPNGNKIVDTGDDRMLRVAVVSPLENGRYEPSPTVEHLRTRNYKTPTSLVNGLRSIGHKNIIKDLEDKISHRNQEIYRPFESQKAKTNRTRNLKDFRDNIKERKDDKVLYNREFMNYKNSKEENERIMNEIARNMSLRIDDFVTLEQSIDAILGFTDYDPKSRPRYFDMVDEFAMDEDDPMMTDVNNNGATEEEAISVLSPKVDTEELIQRELEELLRLQEEELEYLTSNLSLN